MELLGATIESVLLSRSAVSNSLYAMQETQVRSLGWEEPLEKGMATHSSILVWGIPRTEEGYSPRGLKESDMTE